MTALVAIIALLVLGIAGVVALAYTEGKLHERRQSNKRQAKASRVLTRIARGETE